MVLSVVALPVAVLSVMVLAGSASETAAGGVSELVLAAAVPVEVAVPVEATVPIEVPIESAAMTAEIVVCGRPSVLFAPALPGVTTAACAGAKTAPTPKAVPPSVRTMRRIKHGRKNAGTLSTARSALRLETRKDRA